MTQGQSETTTRPQHAAPRQRWFDSPHVRDPKLYLAPVGVVAILMAILAAMYLGGVLNPQQNLRNFPMGIVNLDAGTTIATPTGDQSFFLGDQVERGLLEGVPRETVNLQKMTLAQAHETADRGLIYGFIVIGQDFSERLHQLAEASFADVPAQQPTITVHTNSRAGAYAGNLSVAVADQALLKVNQQVGEKLTEEVAKLSPGAVLTGTAKLLLANPVSVTTERYKSEIDGTGGGLSAFYYALLLLLAGFTGSMVIHSLTDSILGFIPTEIGPRYLNRPESGLNRLQTLFIKWTMVVLMALIVSGLYLGIGKWLGMPIDHPWALYWYGVLAIAATGIAAISILSVLGTAGLLFNLLAFIVLGVPTSGATIPLEAIPPFFETLSHIEPLHAVYLGARSILYFDAIGNSGLYDALWKTALGIVIGIGLGAVTWYYDKKGYLRSDREVTAEPAVATD